MYEDWGFREAPFQTSSLRADETGDRLLVGRNEDVRQFGLHLSAPPRAVTVEGAIGVGKTSLVNVAIYRLLKRYIETGDGRLYVAAIEPLQLSDEQPAEDFLDSVYSLLARTLIHRATEIREIGWSLPNSKPLNEWLNSPLIQRFGGTIGPAGFQRSAEINDGVSYVRGGFRAEVRDWLQRVFPLGGGGGVVCLIDNLELLRTSARARQIVENLRDPLFGIPGVRWVFCGANGIARSVASSPRLEGYLHAPISVSSLNEASAREIFESRLDGYARWDIQGVPYLPLHSDSFVKLFDILGKNTRSALRYADTYCLAMAGRAKFSDYEKIREFEDWLSIESQNAYEDCDTQVGGRAWKLFDQACAEVPEFGPGDFLNFGFQSSQAMVPHVASLEENGLVVSAVDDTDRRRRTISITPKGWFVRLRRSVLGML
ncbi:winged helix DNA-binding protein [Xanthomonas sacchari]|uniref:winged helix DNA-binding protein n=1 Tax=Xanthomonas sacchari TaxID=56458 RepID=UPI0012E03534|nr:winged helix DNA-binding protein [Xanthomonas sacchari]MCW0392315.1 hypothetical protein [Xanthomonas sacchari]